MAHPDIVPEEVPTLVPTGDDETEIVQFGIEVLMQAIEIERTLMYTSSALSALSNRTHESKSLTMALKLSTVMVYGAKELLSAALATQDSGKSSMPIMSEILLRSTKKLADLATGFIK